MTRQSESLPVALVVVERDGIHGVELRDIYCDGDDFFAVFARSDGSEALVPVDGTKLMKTMQGHVPADLLYRGGALMAPEQEVERVSRESMRSPRAWHEVIKDWAPELSTKLGRPVSVIESKGLDAMDFSPARSVEIREPGGRVTRFTFAFALVRPEQAVAAVFSEHDGYMEFDLREDSVVAEIHEDIYTHWGES